MSRNLARRLVDLETMNHEDCCFWHVVKDEAETVLVLRAGTWTVLTGDSMVRWLNEHRGSISQQYDLDSNTAWSLAKHEQLLKRLAHEQLLRMGLAVDSEEQKGE